MILVPSFMGYVEDSQKATLRANARNVWTAAKAVETQNEVKKSIEIKAYGNNTDVNKNPLKGEIERILGDSFENKTGVNVTPGADLVDSKVKKTIISVLFYTKTNGSNKICAFDGLVYTGDCVEKKT